jgi:branched-chain amino acid transport system substrate-binding protein
MVACVLAALVVAGCGSSSSSSSNSSSSSGGSAGSSGSSKSASGSPINILSIGDTSGATKVIGTTHLAGLKAAAAYYNAHGGIDGHHVTVTSVSDNGDSTTAVSVLIKQLTTGSTPTMIDAGSEAGDSAALIPVLAKRKVFAMALNDGVHQCLSNAATACPNEWTLADPEATSDETATNWMKAHGIKKVGILEEQIDFTENETPQFEQAAKKAGLAYTVAEFPGNAVSLTPQLQQLKQAGAQAVFTEALVAPAGYALKARASLSWNVPMVFDVAASSLDLTKLAPIPEVKNQAYEDEFYEMNPNDPSQGIKDLLKYSTPYGNVGAVPLDVASTGWDEVVALNAAVKTAGGKTDVKSLDAAMLKIPATDPERTFERRLGFSTSNHENVAGRPNDFIIAPAGPIVAGQVHSYK